jgi:hypothetical protein
MKARRVTIPWWVKEGWGCEGMHLPPQVMQHAEFYSNFTKSHDVIFRNHDAQFVTFAIFLGIKEFQCPRRGRGR